MSSSPEKTAVEKVGALLPRLNAARDLEGFTLELTDALVRLGVPLFRLSTAQLTLHPEVLEQNVTWQAGQGVVVTSYPYDITSSPDYVLSPVAAVREGADEVHCRVDVAPEALAFPTLGHLRSLGVTDYLGLPLLHTDGRRNFVSFATTDPAGFSTEHVELLRALLPSLALRLELESSRHTCRSLLEVYLGTNASRRILAGDVRRGQGERIDAAIWFCDLRDFTAMSDSNAVEDVIPVLDRYFEAVAGAVLSHGGDVLKFIGDAMLAIFPIASDASAACASALAASERAIDELAALSRELPLSLALRAGIGLHLGEVLYGNVGARARLDFTVMGSAVNEVTRVEHLCRELDVPLLMTSRFVSSLGGRQPVLSLGAQRLRGVAEPHELFTLARLKPAR